MEASDMQPTTSIRERLARIEHDVEDLKAQVALLDRARAGAQPDRSASSAATVAYERSLRPQEVFCDHCRGGNPPDSLRCMWCGRLMTLLPAAVPQETIAPAQGWEPIGGRAEARPDGSEKQLVGSAPPMAPAQSITPRHHIRRIPVPAHEPDRPLLPGTVVAHREQVGAEPAAHVGPMATQPVPAQPISTAAPQPVPRAPGSNFDFLKRSEFWLNKVGIGLLLLGLAFFFKYSIDRGWLNEQVRVGLGLALGSVLLGLGLVMHRHRPLFSQVLLGGSVASYYITGYAAYQLFNLVSYEVAFGFMALVTALAFALSIREDRPVLALIGVIGGLLTPFVLVAPSAQVLWLVAYTCAVLAGVAAIYMYKGWRSLLWAGFVGGWLVFAVAWLGHMFLREGAVGDRWALQAAALFGLVAFWVVPVLREVLYERNPERWTRPTLDGVPQIRDAANKHVFVLATFVPLVTLGYSRLVWGSMVTMREWGWLTLALAAAYGATAWLLHRPVAKLAYAHLLMAILLGTLAVVQILEGDALILALALEATALHFVSQRLPDRGMSASGHLIYMLVAVWLGERILGGLFSEARLTPSTLTDLAVIALIAASSFAVGPRDATILYRTFAHAAVMGWLFTLLYGLPNWAGLVMLAWAVYACGLYVAHLRLPARFGDLDMAKPAHVILASAALLFVWRISTGQAGDWAVLNVKTLMDAAMVALVAGMSFIVMPRPVPAAYRLAAHFGILALLWRELSVLRDGPSYVMLTWAAYGLVMHYLAQRLLDRFESASLSLSANLPFVGVACWFVLGLGNPSPEVAVFNLPALLSLACIGLAVGASLLVRPRQAALAYLPAAHIALLAWLWRELGVFENGNAYITTAWGVYAIALLVVGLRVREGAYNMPVVYAGTATLLLVVGKLFLVDLAALDPLWRVLLFIGFGGVFLVLSYFFQNVIRSKSGSADRRTGRWPHRPGRPAH
jgi:uncharacterized membrane protein